MFFVLSKVLGFLASPSNLLMAAGLLGVLLLCTRFIRLASWLVVTSLVLLAVAGFSPLGNALMLPLEERFPPWDASRGPPAGIVVLGGGYAIYSNLPDSSSSSAPTSSSAKSSRPSSTSTSPTSPSSSAPANSTSYSRSPPRRQTLRRQPLHRPVLGRRPVRVWAPV